MLPSIFPFLLSKDLPFLPILLDLNLGHESWIEKPYVIC
jgi:hypothetical protein